MTRRTSFPCRKHKWAIRCGKYWGTDFGWGELVVGGEPFNRKGACWSYANEDGYEIPENIEGINMLTNKKCIWFTISSIEVWGVRFKD